MAPNKRAATQKKITPKKTPTAKVTEPKKTPVGKKRGPAAVHTEEQIQRQMQELAMKIHEEKQRKKLLAKDKKSKVSKSAEDNEDVDIEGGEVQAAVGGETQIANRGEIKTSEEVEMETEGSELQVTRENQQVPEVGEVHEVADESQAGDHYEDVTQENVPQGSGIVSGEDAVREGVSINKPEALTDQMFGTVGSVEMTTPFAVNTKKVQTSSVPSTPKTATRKAQENFEKMKAEEDFMEFSNVLQQEVAGLDTRNQFPESITTLNTESDYIPNIVALPPTPQDQRLPSTRPHSQQSLMGLWGRAPVPQQVGHLRCGASGSVDPLFQYKPTQLPPPSRAPSSRSLQRSLQSYAVDSGRVNTPIHSASATSPVVSDPMSPTLYEEKFINQGIAAYFNGKIPPYFRFDTRSIDRMACQLWESQMMRSPSTHEQICVMSSQYSIFKLRVLARLNILPSWWWYREQIVTVLRKSGKWLVEDEGTDLLVKNAVDFQILYGQTINLKKPC